MASIWKVLTWHYGRQAVPMIGLMFLVMILGPLAIKGMFLLGGLYVESNFLGEMSTLPRFYFNYLPLAFVFFAAVVFSGQNDIRHTVYPLPISTPHLVAWHLILGMLSIVVMNVGVLLAYDWLFETGWPIFQPTLLMLAGMVLAQGLGWSLYDFSFRRLGVCILTFAAFCWWGVDLHFPNGYDADPDFMKVFGPLQWIVLAAVTAGGWFLCVRMLGQHRRGETLLSKTSDNPAIKIDELLFDLFSPAQPLFANGLAALRWNEWRRGRLFAVAAGLGVSIIPVFAGIAACFTSTNYRLVEGCLAITCYLAVVSGLVSGQVITMSIWSNPTTGGMSTFFGTAPVSDRDLGRVLLRNLFCSNQLMWATIAVLGLAIPTFVVLTSDAKTQAEILHGLWLYDRFGAAAILVAVALSALSAWGVSGTLGSLCMTGNNRMMAAVIFALVTSAVLGTFVIRFLVPVGVRETVALTVCMLVSLAAVGSSIWLFRRAVLRELISTETALIAVGIWLAEVAFLFAVLPFSPTWKVMFCGVASLTVMPLASAPLAVAWNRHHP